MEYIAKTGYVADVSGKRKCLFCDNKANSREHVWPDWVLRKLDSKGPIYHRIGDLPRSEISAQLKARCVCEQCNRGWMSGLETKCSRIMGPLMSDIAAPLDVPDQYLISMWATKMAMVTEFTSRSHRELFYSKIDCERLRVASEIPARTTIWLARYSGTDIGLWGTDAWTFNRAVHGYVHTIVIGHLALQVWTLHVTGEYRDRTVVVHPKPGPAPWPDLLVNLWPNGRTVNWPPRLTFHLRGPFSLYTLVSRWSYGEKV